MDPFSAFSSAISVLDIAIRASKALHGLCTELAGAPELILALSNETADISIVLSRVSEARKTLDRLDAVQNAAFLTALDRHILTAKLVLSRLDILVTELRSQKGSIKRIKWCLRKNKASVLKDELRAVRQRINEILVAHSATISARVELELHRVNSTIHQNHIATVEHIAMISQATSGQIELMRITGQQQGKLTTGYQEHEGAGVRSRPPTYEPAGSSYQYSTMSGAETSQRIKAIETTLLSLLAEESVLLPPRKKPHAIQYRHGTQSQIMSKPGSSGAQGAIIYFALRSMRSGCTSDCPCRCHQPTPSDTSWALPRALRFLLGSLFVGYAGFPVGRSACDADSCSEAHTLKFQVTYAFPTWFMCYALHGFLEASISGTLTVSLTVRRRVQYEPDSALALARLDDKEALRIKLEADRASVLDVGIHLGQSLLHMAISRYMPNAEIIKMLLQMGADPDCEDDSGRTPRRMLARAVLSNSVGNAADLVAELDTFLPIGRCIDTLGLTYIHKLVCGVYPIQLASALETLSPKRVREQIDKPSADGLTALHFAAMRGDTAAIRALLHAGASVDAEDLAGATALILSACRGNEACVDVLLWGGADVNHADYSGWNALLYAVGTPSLGTVKRLVAGGLDPNASAGREGNTPLAWAAKHDRIETIRYLHQQGARLNDADNDGDTPLCYSIYGQAPGKGHAAFALLLELGADHLVINGSGNTLLHMIALIGNINAMKIIAEKKLRGLNIHTRNKDGLTPLAVFERRGNTSDKLIEAFDQLIQTIETTVEPDMQVRNANMGENVGLDEEDLDEAGDIFEDALEKMDDEETVTKKSDRKICN